MLSGTKLCVLANFSSAPDASNKDRIKKIDRVKVIAARVDLVGTNTAQLGQIKGFNLDYSLEVMRAHYNSQEYAFFENRLYKIKSLSKAKSSTNMLLNVQVCHDKEIVQAIKEWMNANFSD